MKQALRLEWLPLICFADWKTRPSIETTTDGRGSMSTPETPDGIVVIGSSAGGLAALVDLLTEIPPDYALPIVVAAHSSPGSQLLAALRLQRGIRIAIEDAIDGSDLRGGSVHVLPPATHGLVVDRMLRLSPMVRDSGFRPSIDALFMTAAASYGKATIAVVLSGTMNDGMRGAQVVYDMGGRTIVQDPDDADRTEMPQNVINADHPRQVLPATDLGKWLAAAACE